MSAENSFQFPAEQTDALWVPLCGRYMNPCGCGRRNFPTFPGDRFYKPNAVCDV